MPAISTLAQQGRWFSLDDAFWLTILLVFLITVVGAILRRMRRDRCLRLFDDDHVTFLPETRPIAWGDLDVASSGIEIRFDAESRDTLRRFSKTSALIFEDELAELVALTRSVRGLTEAEQRKRRRQIRVRVQPSLWRRIVRVIRNFINMIADAIARAMGMLIGRFTRGGATQAAVQSQQGEIVGVGQTVVSIVGNSYEPLLERHIGQPVVLELAATRATPPALIELPGFLMEYSERFLAICQPDQTPFESFELEIAPGDEPLERPGVRLEAGETHVQIHCTAQDVLVVRKVHRAGGAVDLDLAMVFGRSLRLRHGGAPVHIQLERTHGVDLVCLRARGRIRFGSAAEDRSQRPAGHRGAAPDLDEPMQVSPAATQNAPGSPS